MVKEQFVSFETARLLKKKGFDERCFSFYWSDGELSAHSHTGDSNMRNSTISSYNYTTPTQQMAMRWLREEKYILIFMVPAKDKSGNLVYAADVWTWNEDEGVYEPTWCTSDYVYEKSLETAIKYCLENLIKED